MVNQKRDPHVLHKKVTKKVISKVIRQMAGWTWPNLTFRLSRLASIRLYLCDGGLSYLCGEDGKK